MLRTILVGLADIPHSQAATRHAIAIAQRHQARLTAVTLIDPSKLGVGPVPVGAGDAARELHEHRVHLTEQVLKQAVREFRTACESANIPHEVVHEEGNPLDRMAYVARYHDLIVIGLRNLFTHGVLPSSEHELTRLVEGRVRPVLAVTPTTPSIRRVLIAYSGSAESANAMRRFIQLDLWPDVTIRIVCFDRKSKALDRLAHAAEYCEAHGRTVETDECHESPKDGLLTYADGWNADLIVIGSSARSYLVKKLFGETALHVVSHADRAVFME